MVMGPSFWWATLLFDQLCYLRQPSSAFRVHFLYRSTVLLFDTGSYLLGKLCYLRQASSCSLRYRVRDTLLVCFKLNNQFQALFDSKMVLLTIDSILWFRLLRPLGTTQKHSLALAAVVPSYLVRQVGVPVVEFVQWKIANRYSTLTRLGLHDLG